MTDVKRTILKASNCNCVKQQFLLEIGVPLDRSHIPILTNANGFIEIKSYTNLGILYIEDLNLTAIGPLGSNRLQIKCKNSNCNNSLEKLEETLKHM